MTTETELWHLNLHGIPCPVCELPASGMRVYPSCRRIFHVHPGWPCELPNPEPRPDVRGHYRPYRRHPLPPDEVERLRRIVGVA